MVPLPRAENFCRLLVYESDNFLAQVDFLTPKVFRSSAAAELVAFVLTNAPQTASPTSANRPRFPRSLKHALAKIDIRS
jgi:hypothetical protein